MYLDVDDLFKAVETGNIEAVEKQYRSVYEPNINKMRNSKRAGETVLMLASENNDNKMVEFILSKREAKIDMQLGIPPYDTALTLAVKKGNDNIVQTLLNSGAKIVTGSRETATRDSTQIDAIDVARLHNKQSIVKLLTDQVELRAAIDRSDSESDFESDDEDRTFFIDGNR